MPALAHLLGRTQREVEGRPLGDFVCAEDKISFMVRGAFLRRLKRVPGKGSFLQAP